MNFQAQVLQNLDQFTSSQNSLKPTNDPEKSSRYDPNLPSKPSKPLPKPSKIAQAAMFVSKTKNLFQTSKNNAEDHLQNEVLYEMRKEHEKLKLNTHTLASFMAENEAKKVLIEKLKLQLDYYKRQDPVIFRQDIIDRYLAYKKSLESKVDAAKNALKRANKVENDKNAELCQKINKVDQLQRDLLGYEGKLSKVRSQGCGLKQEVIEVQSRINGLKKDGGDDFKTDGAVIEELKKVVSHIPYRVVFSECQI